MDQSLSCPVADVVRVLMEQGSLSSIYQPGGGLGCGSLTGWRSCNA